MATYKEAGDGDEDKIRVQPALTMPL